MCTSRQSSTVLEAQGSGVKAAQSAVYKRWCSTIRRATAPGACVWVGRRRGHSVQCGANHSGPLGVGIEMRSARVWRCWGKASSAAGMAILASKAREARGENSNIKTAAKEVVLGPSARWRIGAWLDCERQRDGRCGFSWTARVEVKAWGDVSATESSPRGRVCVVEAD